MEELKANLAANCIPKSMLTENTLDYDGFLVERRKLMAAKIKAYFQTL